ncbi:Ig-like domain-containing protein, partial [Psychrobacillus insolitus]|uniref:Ig-like domain-containing protein n=1 Tax=Psychrobacillus insolitus TaxID=1461 RepID=UPI0011B593BA
TSMASPIVAGVAALIKSNEPNLSNIEIENRLIETAVDLGGAGYDIYYGHGKVDAAAALKILNIEAPAIEPVYDDSTEIRGYLNQHVENATINVYKEGIIATQPNYYGNSEFRIPIPQQEGGVILQVEIIDVYGNVSEVKEVTVKDINAPTSPIVNEVTDKATSVTGTAEIGSSISVKAGTTVLGTATTTNEGKYSVTIAKQKAGTKLTVTATDSAGNVSEVKEVTVKDVTAPTLPTVNEVTETSTSVIGIAEAGSTVIVKVGTTVLGTATTTTEGKYSVTIAKQKAGTKLTVIATDSAGNVSEVKEVTVKDVTAPTLPIVNEVTDKATSVTGTAEIGSSITVKAGTTVLGTATTTNEGKYSVTIAKQKAGTKLSVTATDSAGNVSEVKEVTVKDVTVPTLPTVNEVTETSTSVIGTAEAGSTVIVKAGTTVLGTATTTTEGKYSVTIAKQKAGTKLTVTATDSAGNISEVKEVTVKDVTAPTLPTVNEVTETSTSVIGTAEAGSTIIVKAGTTVLGTATTTTEGKYSVTITKQKAGTKLTVTATDSAGNVSEVKEVTVKDITAPTLPIVNEVTDKATSVTGTAEIGSSISVKVGTTVLGTATTTTEGKYSVTIAKQKAGTKLTVTATDSAGNVSEVKEVTVKDVTAPNKPVVDTITAKTTYLTGKAEAKSFIEVKKLNQVIGTITTDVNGNFKVEIPVQTVGT